MGSAHRPSTQLPPPPALDRGVPGVAAHTGPDRRAPLRTKQHHLLDPIISGGSRERRLGERLNRVVGDFSIVLHSRVVCEANDVIDHVVVAPSGVWVVVADHRRSVADVLADGAGDQLAASQTDTWRTDAVAEGLAGIGFDWVDVHAAVCCTNSRRRLISRPTRSNGVWVTRPKTLTQLIAAPGPLAPEDIRTVGAELGARLPAAR